LEASTSAEVGFEKSRPPLKLNAAIANVKSTRFITVASIIEISAMLAALTRHSGASVDLSRWERRDHRFGLE